MRTTINQRGRRILSQPVALAAALLCVLAAATTTSSQSKQEKAMIPVDDLLSEEPRTRDRAVDAILRDRQLTIEALIPLIDPGNAKRYSDETRCAAAYLLGEPRAVEAVPVLSRALADPPGPKKFSDGSRYDSPVFNALVKIGRPAVPAMIENIKTSDNATLRKSSLNVLQHVLGGKSRLLELLVKLSDRALKEQPADREASRRFREAHSWAEAHYKNPKGYEEPLY